LKLLKVYLCLYLFVVSCYLLIKRYANVQITLISEAMFQNDIGVC